MPKFSQIPNKVAICLSIDAVKRDFCKEKNINISLLLDAALERETNPNCKKAFENAIQKQNKNLKEFIATTGLQGNYDDYRYGGEADVVEKKPQLENKQITRFFENI